MKMLNKSPFVLIIVFCALLSACSSMPDHGVPPMQPGSTVEKLDPRDFCYAVAENLTAGDASLLINAFDTRKFLNNALIGVKGNNKSFLQFKQGLETGVKAFPKMLENLVSETTRWDVVRFDDKSNRLRCLLRSGFTHAGVMIFELYLMDASDQTYVVNWFDHIKGTLASDSIRTMALDYKRVFDGLDRGELTTYSEEYQGILKLNQFLTAAKNKDAVGALNYYDLLPRRYKNSPIYASRAVDIATTLGESSHRKYLENFVRRFSERDEYKLRSYDYYLLNKEYDNAILAVDGAIERIGGDPALHLMRAFANREKGDIKAFYANCWEALDADASFEETYWVLLETLAQEKRFEDSVLVLSIMRKAFNYSFTKDGFSSDPKYAELAKSKVFAEWINN